MSPGEARAHALQCMEIWGGHGATHDAVSAPGVDVWIYSKPHAGGARGGDVHYLSGCAAGNILRVVVADVAGHGEAVSEAASALRKLMRKHINTADQSALARRMNAAFAGRRDAGLFATALMGTYWAPGRAFLFVNAGHPRPLLSRGGGAWEALDSGSEAVSSSGTLMGASNLPLGVIAETGYEQLAVRLGEGDRLLLYTDFAVEARSPAGEELGEAGLIALLDGLGEVEDGELIPRLLAGLRSHTGVETFDDDVTLGLIRHHGRGGSPRGLLERARTLGRVLGVLPV